MITVACAIIVHEGKILAAQRGAQQSESGLWEFPGGKLEAGETAASCIMREIREELNIEVAPYHQLPEAVHHYPTKTICLLPLICRWVAGTLQLQEHAAYCWLLPGELPHLHWSPADVPVVEEFLRWRHLS